MWSGRLPPRYELPWEEYFSELVSPSLVPASRILDVGSGRRPQIPAAARPPGVTYVGLDVSRKELEHAPAGSYDDVVVSDLARRVPALEDSFDLIVSWQVLEHVRSLPEAAENMRRYLRPQGRAVALLSGRFSAFGLLNLAVPAALGHRAVATVMRRDPETVFRAHYDHCWDRALRRAFQGWGSVTVTPRWVGASYFRFSRALQSAYIAYEEWAYACDRRDLATHYFLEATR